jgi:hypothetical protein
MGAPHSSPPPFGQEEIERILATALKYGQEILPPPEQSFIQR